MCEGVERGELEGKIVAVIMISEKNTKVLLDTGSGSVSLLFFTESTVMHMFDTMYLVEMCAAQLLRFNSVTGNVTAHAQ